MVEESSQIVCVENLVEEVVLKTAGHCVIVIWWVEYAVEQTVDLANSRHMYQSVFHYACSCLIFRPSTPFFLPAVSNHASPQPKP
jgi:hypothetical protein